MLYLNLNNFSLKNRNDICDETGAIKYWSQPDFAYKSRIHVYGDNDSEIGYIQFKILSIQDGNNFFNYEDKEILMDDFVVINRKDEWDYEIKNNNSIVSVTKNEDKLVIDSKDNIDLDRCILFIVSLMNKE